MIYKNITVADKKGSYVSDVLVEDGKIAKIGPKLQGSPGVDASGLYLLPWLVDVGTNFSDGSFKGVNRVAQKALKSGVGAIINSSKTVPVINNETALESLQLKSSQEACEFLSLVNAKADEGLSDMAILLNKGGAAIEIDSDYDLNTIARAYEYAKLKNKTIVCNANSTSLQGGGMVASGKIANKLGIAGVSTLCESVEVVKIAHMAKYYGVDTLFLNLSSSEGIDQSGSCLVSTSIHHLLLDQNACRSFNTKAKIYPPLRERLTGRLHDIDMITSMHAKTSTANKELSFAQASFGVDVLGEFLALCYTHLVKNGPLSMHELMEKVSYNQAAFFGIDIAIREGSGRFCLFDPGSAFVVDNSDSLYEGQKLWGKIISVQ
ncbi:MAG: hypothetical protein ACQERK_01465 [Campylobacterota bacterium]